MIDGVVDSVRKTCHSHFVRLVRSWLWEPDIHLNERRTGYRGRQFNQTGQNDDNNNDKNIRRIYRNKRRIVVVVVVITTKVPVVVVVVVVIIAIIKK